jgi:hypothetical protein
VTRNYRRTAHWGRWLIGWIAAYALVLHAVLAGVVATQVAVTSLTTTAGFELCLTGADGAAIPSHGHSQHQDCAIHCLTVAGGAPALVSALLVLLVPARATSRRVAFIPSRTPAFLRRAGRSRAPPYPA